MLYVVQTALELGFIYALVAMALFLSYRILDIADMTTDSGFVLGAAVSVTCAAAGHPVLAVFAAMAAGACGRGVCTPDDNFPYYIRIPQPSINCKGRTKRNGPVCKNLARIFRKGSSWSITVNLLTFGEKSNICS